MLEVVEVCFCPTTLTCTRHGYDTIDGISLGCRHFMFVRLVFDRDVEVCSCCSYSQLGPNRVFPNLEPTFLLEYALL